MRMLIPALTLPAAVALATGCGPKTTTATTGTPAPAAIVSTIRIVEQEFSLTPSTITVAKAGIYKIDGVNQGHTSHAIAIDGQGVDERGPAVGPGGTSSITVALTKPGAYRIFCPVGNHASLGMEGTLTLSGAGAAGSSGGTSTGDSSNGYG